MKPLLESMHYWTTSEWIGWGFGIVFAISNGVALVMGLWPREKKNL